MRGFRVSQGVCMTAPTPLGATKGQHLSGTTEKLAGFPLGPSRCCLRGSGVNERCEQGVGPVDDRQAGVLATKLGDHPASHPVVKQLGGIVRRVLGTAIADGAITGIALDESDKPVIVAVSNGRAIRLQAIGDSSDDFSIASELLHFDRPDVSISVEHVHLRDGFSNEIFVRRSWRATSWVRGARCGSRLAKSQSRRRRPSSTPSRRPPAGPSRAATYRAGGRSSRQRSRQACILSRSRGLSASAPSCRHGTQ